MTFASRLTGLIAALLGAACALLPLPAAAQQDQDLLVERARRTLNNFVRDPDMRWFRDNASSVRAVLIVPEMVKVGIVIGGSAGTGVAFRRDAGGAWGGPVFFTLTSGSFGLQLGAQISEVMLLMMNERGAERLLSNSFKLGPDASVAAGPVGVGTGVAPIADIVSFSYSQGLFAGISLEGTVLSPRDEWNRAYYGSASLNDVLSGKAGTARASDLRADVQKAMGGAR